jgi:uncharacterized protein YecE (DUF72 family)
MGGAAAIAARARARVSLFIGTANWNIPRQCQPRFPETGTHLERYAQTLNAVEINSSFHRHHQPRTYARWAASVPHHFRFSIKAPKEITHTRRLIDVQEPLEEFLSEATSLGSKLGPILIQLPPSMQYEKPVAQEFFALVRSLFAGRLVLEPRHYTWFGEEADHLLGEHQIARVAADPAVLPAAARPGGWSQLRYYRLHGSPRIYYSEYSAEFLAEIAKQVRDAEVETWCIFDNTAVGHGTGDAIRLLGLTG